MAKVSARGARPVGRVTLVGADGTAKHRLLVRSDGAVLHALDTWRDYSGGYWVRGGWAIHSRHGSVADAAAAAGRVRDIYVGVGDRVVSSDGVLA